ncbi:MAG: hypothetical protein L6V81_08540 [Clostridium sp.]|nr:MAG: hypothetical protein L6V81_08540 [Clostridium sp.]
MKKIFNKLNTALRSKELSKEETAYDLVKQIYPNEISRSYSNKYLNDDTKKTIFLIL